MGLLTTIRSPCTSIFISVGKIASGVSIAFIIGGVLSFIVAIAFLAVGGVRSDDAYIRAGVGMLVTGLTAIFTVIVVLILMVKCCKCHIFAQRQHDAITFPK